MSGSNAFVSPVSEGSVTITVTDSISASSTVSVSVGAVAGSLILSTSHINLSTATVLDTESTTSQMFTAERYGDTSLFTLSVTPAGIVSVTGSGSAPGPVTFTVNALMVGSATVSISTDDGTTSSLTVNVTGALAAAVYSPHRSTQLLIAVSESNYSGTFTPELIGSTSATITPSLAYGPRAIFTVNDATPGESFLLSFTDANSNQTVLSLQSKNVSIGPVTYTFFDESGVNPVAPGSQYDVYYIGDPQIAENIVMSGFLGVGGIATISLDEDTEYVITWSGQQAPSVQTFFTTLAVGATNQSITTIGYRSPFLSTLGYANQQLSNWTRGWIGDEFKQPGLPGITGVGYNLAYSLAASLGEGNSTTLGLDTFLQNILVGTRLSTCAGNLIDTWFQQFLGPNFKRQDGETDALFLARGLVAINGEIATRDALNKATNAAWQTLGNNGQIVCDDNISNPSLMSDLDLSPPYFVVTLPTINVDKDAFFLDQKYLGVNTYLLSLGTSIILNPSEVPPLVYQAVEAKRALGCLPVYTQVFT